MVDEIEEWRPVWWAPYYEVSSLGRVRSTTPRGRSTRPVAAPRILRPAAGHGGHLHLLVCVNKVQHTCRVHVLVAEAFKGKRPTGLCVRHLDGNPTNNRPENLEWGTRPENEADMVRHGTDSRGIRNANAKLTIAQAAEIRGSTERGDVLAERYGVSEATISRVRNGTRYAIHFPQAA